MSSRRREPLSHGIDGTGSILSDRSQVGGFGRMGENTDEQPERRYPGSRALGGLSQVCCLCAHQRCVDVEGLGGTCGSTPGDTEYGPTSALIT
jgi:hypothetical protein